MVKNTVFFTKFLRLTIGGFGGDNALVDKSISIVDKIKSRRMLLLSCCCCRYMSEGRQQGDDDVNAGSFLAISSRLKKHEVCALEKKLCVNLPLFLKKFSLAFFEISLSSICTLIFPRKCGS